jgi:hypothetical protein
MATVEGPYTTETETDLDYAAREQRYAATSAVAPYNTEFGWAAHLRTGLETPDSQRLGIQERHDRRPNPVRPPEEFWGRIDADTAQRHSVEDVDADGWEHVKGASASGQRFAPNPRSVPPPENRLTQRMAPRSYSFFRRYGGKGNGPAVFNGLHFSMADHRRDYPILGMQPVTSRRNTYRLDPPPWDQDVVDLPPQVEPDVLQARYQSAEVPYQSRSWRL